MASSRNVSIGAVTLIIGLLAGNVLTSIFTNRNVPTGSVITAGNVVLVTANKANSSVNNYPSVVVDSGSVRTWAGGAGIPGGGKRLTASGSRNFVQNFLVPTTYASGAVLRGFSEECDGVPLANSGVLVANQPVLKAAMTTGTNLRKYLVISSGSYVYANTGSVIQIKLLPGTYLSYITSASGQSVLPNCVGKPEFAEKYGR